VTAKTTAQWRREVPAYDKAIRAAEHLLAARPTWAGRVIAHIHPDTLVVSILLRGPGSGSLTSPADRLLAKFGYRTGGWAYEDTHGVEVWRKTVAR
jgi:hypothetical protein